MNPQFQELLKGFCRTDCDRFSFLTTFLDWKKIPYTILDSGGRHILISPGGRKHSLSDHYFKVLTAHYDRVEGTPGANDNSASVFILLKHLDLLHKADFPHNSLILLTDREELAGKKNIFEQGSYQLGGFWKKELGENYLFMVLDMCGIGNTLIWGRNDLKLQKENPEYNLKSSLISRIDMFYDSLENLLYRYSRQNDMAVNDLFSDDLGFILNGLPAMQLSLLPWKEAEAWKKDSTVRPESWKVNHSENDVVETLQDSAFLTMEKFLRDLARYQFPLP